MGEILELESFTTNSREVLELEKIIRKIPELGKNYQVKIFCNQKMVWPPKHFFSVRHWWNARFSHMPHQKTEEIIFSDIQYLHFDKKKKNYAIPR